MATPVFCCGFECAQIADAAAHWGNVNTATISTTTVRSGLRSGRCNPSAVAGMYFTHTVSGQANVIRSYVRFTTLPNADCQVLGILVGSDAAGAFFQVSDSKIYAGSINTGVKTVGATGIAVTTGKWYLIDCKVISSANPWTIDVQVDGVACAQSTNARVAANATSIAAGPVVVSGTMTADSFYDDVLLSLTPADYPLGAGKVLSFVAASDGTHTSVSNDTREGTLAAPAGGVSIVAGVTDSFNWQNGIPLLGGATDNTRLVACIIVDAGYAEWVMQQTTEAAAPRAVEFAFAHQEAGTGVCDATYKLNDGGTEGTIGGQSGAGAVSARYGTKQFATPPTGGAWTLTKFNALRVRGGYSTDALPDVYLRGWMCEAEFAAVAASRPPSLIVRQAVKRSAYY